MVLIFITILIGVAFSQCNKTEYTAYNEAGEFSLLPLPYDYKVLEPVLWNQIVYIHYTKEQGKFIDPLNEIVSGNANYSSLTASQLLMQYGSIDTNLSFNAGGYYNHALFWWSLITPSCAKREPEGQLSVDIQTFFGNFSIFQNEFNKRAISLFGSGWIWLCRTRNGILKIKGKSLENNPLIASECYPIFGVDMWEHSYYLFYFDDAQSWVERWWGLLDWDLIEYWYETYTLSNTPIPV
jgi:superoxide dismutase, Fe-Mn family